MPGRSCVALTLLIIFHGPAAGRLLKIADFGNSGWRRYTAKMAARGMTRGAPDQKIASSANKQYRRADSAWSIFINLSLSSVFVFNFCFQTLH